MRRLLFLVAISFLFPAKARADQGWQDNQDGNNFALYDVGSIQANNLISASTLCAFADPSGNIFDAPICSLVSNIRLDMNTSSPSGNVGFSATNTSAAVDAAAGLFLANDSGSGLAIRYASVATGNQVIWLGPVGGNGSLFLDRFGVGFSSAAFLTNATGGFVQLPSMPGTPIGTPLILTGQTPIVFDSTHGQLDCYSGGAWAACDSAGSGTVTSVTGTTGRIVVTPATPNPAVDLATFGTASTCAWANVVTDAWGRTTCTANTAPQPAGNYMTAVTHDAIGSGPGSTSVEVVGVTDGTSVDHPVAASAWTNGQALAIDGSAAIHTVPFQAPLTACTDYVSLTCVSGATDLGGTNATPTVTACEAGAALKGDVIVANISAPSTPATGKLACYGDATAKNWTCKNDAGVVTHGVQTQAGATNNFVTSISAAGVASIAQPSFTDLAGTMSLAQEPTIAAHTIIANGTGLSAQAAQTSIGTTMAFDGTAQLQCI
ncbi:MAG TPA: hypothetical protein VN541_22190, partial [Tepidisphaeraceae bacterium]|nr:hypothetical protein [Tepidisphaeraceae bacterium]